MPKRKTAPKTVTPRQLAANRANAARSTGPRTPAGKARSSRNACKYSFSPADFGVVRLEDLRHLASLVSDVAAVYQPVNSQELFAIERIALAQQSILRAGRLESGLLTDCLDSAYDRCSDIAIPGLSPEIVGNIDITRQQNRNFGAARGFHSMVSQSRTWTVFLRYQAQAERHYRRAVEEFERLKALRKELPNEPVHVPQPEDIKLDTLPKTNPSPPSPDPLPPAGPVKPE